MFSFKLNARNVALNYKQDTDIGVGHKVFLLIDKLNAAKKQ